MEDQTFSNSGPTEAHRVAGLFNFLAEHGTGRSREATLDDTWMDRSCIGYAISVQKKLSRISQNI